MHQAVLRTSSKDGKSVSQALEADNEQDKKLRIVTKEREKRVVSEIETNSIRTLLSTLDDLVRCQIMAERALEKEND